MDVNVVLVFFLLAFCQAFKHETDLLQTEYDHYRDRKNSDDKILDNKTPNVIVMLVDDLGYGDLTISGHPTSSTPNIDALANMGKFFTQFYVTSPVCSPSRASLLTGRYQVRSGVYPGTFVPESVYGLPQNETTIAEVLKKKGYSTLISGKWHLGVGVNKEFLPFHHGFDDYLGVPYSHDMCPCHVCFPDEKPCYDTCWSLSLKVSCPLISNTTIIEQPVYLPSLSQRLIDKSKDFITHNVHKGTPFFLYMPFHHVHHPQFASEKHEGTSSRGTFGDSLAELDDSIGQIHELLNQLNVFNNTIIWLTSDNGPSMMRHIRGGSAGLLRCGKGTTWEGGVRVPTFVTWFGHIEPGRTGALASSLDILPTLAAITESPTVDLVLDGTDISPLLFSKNDTSPREFFAVYQESPNPLFDPVAVVWGKYKAHYYTKGSDLSDDLNYDPMCPQSHKLTKHDPPLLFDLNTDPGERWDMSLMPGAQNVTKIISRWRDAHRMTMTWMPARTAIYNNTAQPCCSNSDCTPFPLCCDCNSVFFS